MSAARTCRRSSFDQWYGHGLPARPPCRIAQAPQGLGGNAHRAQAEVAADVDHQPPHRWVQVHVLVRIGMVERQAGGSERSELRAYFRGELPANLRAEEIPHPEAELIGRKLASRIDEIGNYRHRQHGGALDHHQVQPDPQGRQRARASHCIRGGGSGNHQARGIQDAVAMRALDCLIDRLRQPEIVGGEDDVFHASVDRARFSTCKRPIISSSDRQDDRSLRALVCGVAMKSAGVMVAGYPAMAGSEKMMRRLVQTRRPVGRLQRFSEANAVESQHAVGRNDLRLLRP